MSKKRQWILIGAGVIAVVVAASTLLFSRHWPFTRAAVTKLIENRFARGVQIGSFRETWFPPGCVADNVRLLHRERKDLPPLITAREVVIKSSWTGVLHGHVTSVKAAGLHIVVPPADPSGELPPAPQSGRKSKLPSIGLVEAENADLVFLPRVPGASKTALHIHRLELKDVSPEEALTFRVSLPYGKPPGDLTAWGNFGPWNKANVGATPISGGYRLSDVDLAAFHGLSGLLAADGKFKGNLSKVAMEGAVDVPDLHLDRAPRSVDLRAHVRASVDPSNLNMQLENVEAQAGRTTILASGTVTGPPDESAKTANVEIRVDNGRVEDLLNYFSDQKHPSMAGAVKVRAQVELPPGPGFLKRVRLTGEFTITGAEFTSRKRQESVDRLSESAAGESKKQQEQNPETVMAAVSGHVAARGGVATLSDVSFEFPGAAAGIAGTFNLLSNAIDFHGTLRTSGRLPDATTGFEEVLLKKRKTTVAPFTITGNSSHPSIMLDPHRLK